VTESNTDHVIRWKWGGSAKCIMVAAGQVVEAGRSLKSLVSGFVLTKQMEGKSHRTVEFYSENLKRFLWCASGQGWSDDIRMLTEWDIREFLGYSANDKPSPADMMWLR